MWLVNTAPTFGVDFGAASVGTVTVTITRSDGTAVVTDAATTNNGDGTYSYQLVKTNNTKIDRLKLDWKITATTEEITLYEEIVGNLLFTIEEARGARFTGQQTPLSSTSSYSDSNIARMRKQITTQFEEKTTHSWIRRYCRMELTGNGSRVLSLYDGHARDVNGNEVGGAGRLYNVAKIISASIGGVAVTVGDLELSGRQIIHTTGTWTRGTITSPHNIVVEYEYGDDPVDLEARENGLRAVVANLVPSDVPDYAQTISHTGESLSLQQNLGLRVWPEKTREWLDRNPRRRIPVAI